MGLLQFFKKKREYNFSNPENSKKALEKRYGNKEKIIKEESNAFKGFMEMANSLETFKSNMLTVEKQKMDMVRASIEAGDGNDDSSMFTPEIIMKILDRIKPAVQTQPQQEFDIAGFAGSEKGQEMIKWARENRKEAHAYVDKFLDK